jgi:uncharacterized protein YecT (DUF1311 family)
MKGFHVLTGIVLMLSALAARAGNVSPSFDCSKARTATEKAICQSPKLSVADVRLSHMYRTTLNLINEYWSVKYKSEKDGERSLKSTQRNWLVLRDLCGDKVQCIGDQLTMRNLELQTTSVEMLKSGDPGAFIKPFFLNQKHLGDFVLPGDTSRVAIKTDIVPAKTDDDDAIFRVRLIKVSGQTSEIDIPVPGPTMPPGITPEEISRVILWGSNKQSNAAKSAVDGVYVSDARVSDALKTHLGKPGTLLGISLSKDLMCVHECTEDDLYLFYVDKDLHVTPLLDEDWGDHNSSFDSREDSDSDGLELFVGGNSINALYITYTTTTKYVHPVPGSSPDSPDMESKTSSDTSWYCLNADLPAFEPRSDDQGYEDDGLKVDFRAMEDLHSIKVKYIPAGKK